ncbi:glycosyltransferase [Cyanobium sp. N5-Cardenillas]|uniref:glycosyltransferase family 2 protein n=1 Tax=Cyanobium sp. N5-Cardenillas TaxID=2823720 RepID=UPI0020CE4B98|nr:glycosyltransferase [Cyanobium sp. N5-Cardenillas]MCP9786803.1 glycosyltransferase [Cyanobium sp. N5-Cardenillas]
MTRLHWAVLLLTLLGARYLHWRLGESLNLDTPLAASLSLLTLAAELVLLAGFFLQLWFTLLPGRPAPEAGPLPLPAPPVDVLVPSCGEPADLVERCLRGCLAMDYPALTVWLLDDAGRPELAELCERLGCRYLARDDHSHAKAGNLNHGLGHCQGELVAVFDADVVPLRPFLRRTVGLFRDPSVGFVQTPQSYMNADPVMRNLRLERWLLPDEESFYRWIQPTRQNLNAVVCAGTSFVMRRDALERVGGFETATPSEDLATGIRITAAGYRNHYLSEKLSAGLAPFTAAAMARQRCRWGSGSLQTLRTGADPLRIPGLSPLQRLAYSEGILHWFSFPAQLVLLCTPLSLGLLGIAPILIGGEALVTVALPFFLCQLLLTRWLSGHARAAILPELYRWIFLLPICAAVVSTALGRPRRFRVTPKAVTGQGPTGPDPGLLLPLLVLLALQLLALANLAPGRLPLLAGQGGELPVSAATLGVVLGWSVLNGLLLLLAIRSCWDRPRSDGVPWFALSLPLRLHHQGGIVPGRLQAISAMGAELSLESRDAARALEATAHLTLEGLLPDQALPFVPMAQRAAAIGGTWGPLTPLQRDRLETLLYRREGLWPTLRAPFELRTLPLVLLRTLQRIGPESWFRRSLIPQLPPLEALPLPRHADLPARAGVPDHAR